MTGEARINEIQIHQENQVLLSLPPSSLFISCLAFTIQDNLELAESQNKQTTKQNT